MSQWENQMFISVCFHCLRGKEFGRYGFPRIAMTPIFQNSLLHQVQIVCCFVYLQYCSLLFG